MPTDPFPLLYHYHHQSYSDDLPFWLELATQQGGPLLELGCGTGRVMQPLVKAGFQVVGLDNSPGMLEILRQKWSLSTPPSLVQADMTCFHLGHRFRLILLPCNTYSTFTATQRRSTLACAQRHLATGGAFAVSLPNPDFLRQLPRYSEAEVEETFLHPIDSEPVQVSSGWERTQTSFCVTWHYDHLLSDGLVERTSVVLSHTLEPMQVFLQELQQAGFSRITQYGDFDKTSYTSASTQLILIAK